MSLFQQSFRGLRPLRASLSGRLAPVWNRSWWLGLVKATVFLLLLHALYTQLWAQDSLSVLWATFTEALSWQNAWIPAVVLALMPLNWLAEARKWQGLQSETAPISLGEAWRGVWAGVTVSLFTPNRMGDYAGKILVVADRGKNVETVLAALLANFSQMAAIFAAGAAGGAVFWMQHRNLWEQERELTAPVLFGAALLAIVPPMLYFHVGRLYPLLRRLPYFGPKLERLAVLKQYRPAALARALVLSLLRYGIYSVQYYLLLRFFGIGLSPGSAFPAISVIFLLQTGIPLPPLTALAARGGIALMVWGAFTDNELAVLSSTFGLWLLNVIVPALFGALYIFRIGEKNAPERP
jgi:hypothetical protein